MTDIISKDYVPFGGIDLCSNKITGPANIITIGNVKPILIGQGKNWPLVWLKAILSPAKKEFIDIVEASESRHRNAVIITDAPIDGVTILYGSTLVLRVQKKSKDQAIVDKLDLRPLGINIFGDSQSLTMGGRVLQRNSFEGVGTIFAFSE
jgi:hypothetical protein